MHSFYSAVTRELRFFILVIIPALLCTSGDGFAFVSGRDSTTISLPTAADNGLEIRNFPQLTQLLEQQDFTYAQQTSELTREYLDHYVGHNAYVESLKQRASDAIDKVIDLNNFVGELRPDGLFQLPLGMKKVINSTTITIAIAQVKFESGYAELTAFARLDIPQEPKRLFFGIEGIKLTYDGGIVGDAKLVLLGDIPIRINGGSSALILKGGNDLKLSSTTGSHTYLAFDCNGFKELSISADVEFPRSLLIPVDANCKQYENPAKRVKGSFTTVVSDWSDILIELDLPYFQIPYLKDITFHVSGAMLDLSDLRNCPGIVYPRNYERNYMVPDSPGLWRGVYARAVKIILPPQFKDKTDMNRRISFTGLNMLIDNNGLSGIFNARNILPFSKGTASGWKFSVDEMGIAVEANNLTGASFKGFIRLPVADQDTLAYTAIIMPEEYLLRVETVNTLDFTMWNARVEIDPNSYVQLHMADDTFKPEAMLNGRMSLSVARKSNSGKSIGEFDGLEFQCLHIMTEVPYLEVDYFGYAGEVSFSGFPVSLEDIAVTAAGGKAALGFTVKLNLMEGQFGGKAMLEVRSELQQQANGDHEWKYDGINLTAITINATISGSLKIAGALIMIEDDPVYGDGIAGMLQATFIPIKLEVKSRAIFGAKDFRYWLVEGSVSYGDGVPVFGPLRIHGFGGGASYHMKRNVKSDNLEFIPDVKTHFGIRAAVLFNIATRSLVDGEASFEVGFNKNYGINYIGFFGDAKFMGQIPGTENVEAFVNEQKENIARYEDAFLQDNPVLAQKLERMKINEPSKAAEVLMGDLNKLKEESAICAHVGMLMDFTNKTFHSTFDVFVNVAGGLLRGTGPDNRAGWSVMHLSPDEWYVHMGTPVDRIGIQFGLGSFSLKTGGYFMAGSKVLDSPPPPQAVADILGVEIQRLDYMRDLNALEDGRGFAYGTNFSVSTGDITFLILYANFQAGAGFDMMLRDYGDAHCEGSTKPIGIDGWFANGQAYAYLQGEVGVSIRVFGIKKKFSVLRGGSAVLLQAKLPNPTAFKGYMAVKVDVLGGLVSGSFRLRIALGNDCRIVNDSGSPLALNVISDLKPLDQSKEVDVFAAPQAAFNMRMEQPFYMDDDSGTKTYRIRLDEFSVTDNGQVIPGKIVWNNNHDIATFYSTEVLPPQKTLKATVRVGFEIKQGETWQVVYDQGKKAAELKEISFATSTAPDNIPLSNVEYAYPVVEQRNYYRDESTEGYIQLKRGQSYLFPADWKYEIRLGKTGQASDNQTIHYNVAERRIDFTLRPLEFSSSYFIGLMAVPNDTAAAKSKTSAEQLIKTEDADIAIKNNQADDVLQAGLGKSLIDYAFHTSKHALFADKVKAFSIREPFIGKVSTDVINLQPLMAAYEPFDIPEMTGTAYTGLASLVKVTAVPDDPHYTQDIYPLLYRNYPVANGIRITNRDTTQLGLYPSKSMPILSFYLTAADNDETNPSLSTRLPYVYDLTRIYHRDFIDLQAQIVNRFLGTPQQSQYAYIIMGSYPMMRYGSYKANFRYVLPNGKNGSSGVFAYFNPIR
jgi:hypothetical protein